MPSLKLLQKRFTSSAFGAVDPALVASVRGGGKLTAAEAVNVYRDGYPARLSEALGETFVSCWRMLGDDDFLKACNDYARKVPSKTHNLSDYGGSFPGFLLKRFKKEAPFIADLGSLEWSFKELFHAPAHAGLAPGNLSVAVKENSVLMFGSAVKILPFTHKVHGLWKRDRKDNTPLNRSDWEGRECILLYKNGGSSVFSRVLAAPEAAAFRSLFEGRPLGEALAAAKGLDEAAARNLFSFVSEAGLVTRVR
jgi:hypothetical protein